jgi:SAM-dependent methyltransferase
VKRKPLALDAYEELADAYAELVATKPHNAYLERPTTLSLLPEVRGLRVLDVGCGPGFNSEWLVRRGAEVVAFDVSQRMVEHARKRLGDLAEIHLHDVEAPLDFLGGGSVDVVLAALVLDYVEDWRPVLQEFRRVLKEGGVLVFSVGHPIMDYVKKTGGEDYFKVEPIEMTWTGFGTPLVMPSYRRPIMDMTESLHEAGFIMERIVEARPTEDYRRADPEGYEKVSRRPSFLCFKARPEA